VACRGTSRAAKVTCRCLARLLQHVPLGGNKAFDNYLLPNHLLLDGATKDLGRDYAERLLRTHAYLSEYHPVQQPVRLPTCALRPSPHEQGVAPVAMDRRNALCNLLMLPLVHLAHARLAELHAQLCLEGVSSAICFLMRHSRAMCLLHVETEGLGEFHAPLHLAIILSLHAEVHAQLHANWCPQRDVAA
jgi:hypothetical protein